MPFLFGPITHEIVVLLEVIQNRGGLSEDAGLSLEWSP